MSTAIDTKRVRKVRRKHTTPEVGSLWDVLHDHQGTSLFVLPICWTDLHPKLLNCRFQQLPPQKTPTPTSSHSPRRSPRTSPTIVALGRDLDTLSSTETPRNMLTKNRALRNVMSTLFPTHLAKPKTCAELDLRFGGRFYPKAVRCQALWRHPDAAMSFDSATTWASNRSASQLISSMHVNFASDEPVLAYVSRSNLDHIRRNCFRIAPGPGRSYNGPVHRLQMLRSKNLIPSNLDEDQYFVAVIIAMAQHSIYGDGPRGAHIAPRDVKVRLMTTCEEDAAFIIYAATVPAASLMMFHEPHKAPASDAQIKVDYTRVPIWPVMGLKERLGQALGRDVVGHFDEHNMEMFEEETLAPIPESASPKRRRDVLTEVLNASFSEDRESSRDGNIGKRRCLEEGRVGVVR